MQKANTADTVAATVGSNDSNNDSFCSLNERTPLNSPPQTPRLHKYPTDRQGPDYSNSTTSAQHATATGHLCSFQRQVSTIEPQAPLSEHIRRKWVPRTTIVPCSPVCREPTARPRDPPPPKPPPYLQRLSHGSQGDFASFEPIVTTRFMPPPPPSLQSARAMLVGSTSSTPTSQAGRPLDSTQTGSLGEPRTCPAEGDFAFLVKTPGTSDWTRGGFGATYAATVVEGAPAETFEMVDVYDESFQSLLRILMRWYVRVAGLFGCSTPSANNDAPSVNVSAARSHLRPNERLPRSYFARTAVPPCPSPFAYFTTAEHGDLHIVSDVRAFVAWHDAVHGWWDMQIRPRSVGYGLHMQLYRKCQKELKRQATDTIVCVTGDGTQHTLNTQDNT